MVKSVVDYQRMLVSLYGYYKALSFYGTDQLFAD